MKLLITSAIAVSALAALLVFASPREKMPTTGTKKFSGSTETAVFAGGCFWGLQATFVELPGVVNTRAGYTGGAVSKPTYEQVVAGRTGHAEAVEVVFDPARISFEQVVRHFFAHHRPTSDEPTETYRKRAYRSAIFVSSPVQRETAERIRTDVAETNGGKKPVATLIEDEAKFWEAEAYHQNYLANCPH